MKTISIMKYGHSPARNMENKFVSTPTSYYPPAFDNTINPIEALTPQSLDGDCHFNCALLGMTTSEKKPVKKRKSWGQQLPEPKTNLPPRKRAKTEDEKEQRRVERVLRNRRAAQSSRERKRQEVEALEAEKRAIERKNMDLEMRLADLNAKYHLLQMEVERFGCGQTALRSSSDNSNSHSPELRQPSPVTFSMELFSSQDEISRPISPRSTSSRTSRTVDPTTLTPESRTSADSPCAVSSDMIQHPAAVLCDLQCQSEVDQLWKNLISIASTMIIQLLMVIFLFTTCEAFLKFLVLPNQIVKYLKKRFFLLVLYILNLNTLMVTMIAFLTTLSFVITLTMKLNQSRSVVRTNLPRQLLACSPNLARPFRDATMAALRSESKHFYLRALFSTEFLYTSDDRPQGFKVLTVGNFLMRNRSKSYETHVTKSLLISEIRLRSCDQENTLFRRLLGRNPVILRAKVFRYYHIL